MDCTASMTQWIQACKKELNKIIDFIQEQHKNCKIRVSFVGYRDHGEGKYRHALMDFTEDIDIVKNFISKTPALGGGDEPEDIAGALKQAIQMNWKSKVKYAVLVCDAPCHGSKYHDLFDNYQNGDPYGLDPEIQIREFAQKSISFYAIKIKETTNKMFQILSNSYENIANKKLQVEQLGDATNSFAFYIANTVNITLSNSVMGTQASVIKNAINILKNQKKDQNSTQFQYQEIQNLIEQLHFQDENNNNIVEQQQQQQKIQNVNLLKDELNFNLSFKSPNWKNLENSKVDNAICHTFFIVKDKGVDINWKKPLLQNSQIKTTIRICQEPFNKGEMRYAFYAKDEKLNQKLVAKLPKIISADYNIECLKKDLEITFICQHIVNEFNDKLIPLLEDANILFNFVHTFIYELENEKKFKYYQVENFIEGNYEKYNNNAGWYKTLSAQSQLSQTFSHFSWQLTQGFLMIVDLQGVPGVLTDPQIHCADFSRFGRGNLGYEGILKFFFTHKCNEICKYLELLHPYSDEFNENSLFYINRPLILKNMNQNVKVLCDLCRYPFQIMAMDLQEKQLKNQEKYCTQCDKKRKETMKKGICDCCNTDFKSSEYWFLMKRTDFPVLCGQCRKKRRNTLRSNLQDQEMEEEEEEEQQ